MKGKINTNFDIRIYKLDGSFFKAFYNLNEDDTEHLYAYYALDDSLIVDIQPSETLYHLLEIKEDKRRR